MATVLQLYCLLGVSFISLAIFQSSGLGHFGSILQLFTNIQSCIRDWMTWWREYLIVKLQFVYIWDRGFNISLRAFISSSNICIYILILRYLKFCDYIWVGRRKVTFFVITNTGLSPHVNHSSEFIEVRCLYTRQLKIVKFMI